ncbi:hypothetical protein M758_7G137600 [Ceratodon purpureus]|nr:hypothetical protein M758_7G137600 [Ceratodon purpureus]
MVEAMETGFATGKEGGIEVEVEDEGVETMSEALVSSPGSVIGPHTPEAAGNRRTAQRGLVSDAGSYDTDFDEEEVGSVSYDDDDVADLMEEPVAVSRVRAFALARRSTGRECKVTLESARAKLDRVKATREKHLKKRKLENFLSGEVDDGVNVSLPSEFQGQPKVVKSKGFSVEKARAKLEAVKIKRELDKTDDNKHSNLDIILSPGKSSRKASKACIVDEEFLHEGIWLRQAKLKLEAARKKSLKFNRKRRSKALGTKKRNVQRRSSLEVSCMDREDKEDHVDLIDAADGVKIAGDSEVAKEPISKGKSRKAPKLKAVRVSERIANSRLRMQQELVTLKVKAEIGSKRTKSRRNKGNKREEPNTEIRTDLSRTEYTEATTSERDTESSAVSLEPMSSVEFTPPAKRRKIQQTLVDVIPPPGSRLSSGVECVPPVSPYGLIQEHVYQDPWKVLVACILLNQTGGRQMHKVIWDLFELCPDAETCVSTETEKIGRVIHSLGLQNKRAKTLQRFSQDYLGTTWTNVTQLHGIGEYGRDAYAIFCEGRWQEVQPKDLVLNRYCRWLNDTEGLGYGFSQIE